MYAFAICPRAHAVEAIAIERIRLAVFCDARKYVIALGRIFVVNKRVGISIPHYLYRERCLLKQLAHVIIEL